MRTQQGYRGLFAPASEWVRRLGEAHQRGRLSAELARLRRYPPHLHTFVLP